MNDQALARTANRGARRLRAALLGARGPRTDDRRRDLGRSRPVALLRALRRTAAGLDPQADWARGRPRARTIITGTLNRLSAPSRFLTPATTSRIARARIRCDDQPGGAAYYAFQVRQQTTTDLTPRQIHDIGLRESPASAPRWTGWRGTPAMPAARPHRDAAHEPPILSGHRRGIDARGGAGHTEINGHLRGCSDLAAAEPIRPRNPGQTRRDDDRVITPGLPRAASRDILCQRLAAEPAALLGGGGRR